MTVTSRTAAFSPAVHEMSGVGEEQPFLPPQQATQIQSYTCSVCVMSSVAVVYLGGLQLLMTELECM